MKKKKQQHQQKEHYEDEDGDGDDGGVDECDDRGDGEKGMAETSIPIWRCLQ